MNTTSYNCDTLYLGNSNSYIGAATAARACHTLRQAGAKFIMPTFHI